jgi:peroxiredoxin
MSIALSLVLAPLAALPQELDYRSPPVELGPHAPRVGEWIPDLAWADRAGAQSTLSAVAGEHGLVIALRDVDCPLSKRYAPRLAELEGELAELGFGLLYVGVQPSEECERDVETYALTKPYAVDADGALARALGAATTTEVFVLDRASTVRYRGCIDDQYGLGFAKPAVEREYLREALAAVAAGGAVLAPATTAQGCLLEPKEGAAPAAPLTWHERTSRIVQRRCEGCHRTGGVAPFALETFDQVQRRARMIKFVLEEDVMPPWFAAHDTGPWSNDTSLAPAEEADLLAWIAAGTPEGDAAHAPLAVARTEGWSIGQPDLVVAMSENFDVPADGVVDYQYFDVHLDTTEERWVQAVEVRPGARAVVHHVILWVNEKGAPRRQDGGETFFTAHAPGTQPLRFAHGFAKRLPAGARLTFQMHYTPNGTAASDRTEVGFVFADAPPAAEVVTASALNDGFAIPPGAFDHEVRAEYVFPADAAILTLFPHSHLRGVRWHYELAYPDGRSAELLSVPQYDFNWQLFYDLQTPLEVPRGTKMIATAWFDNTDGNPANPDPTATVRFGEQTFEEMMIGYVNWVPAGAREPVEASAPSGGGRGR